ncbi:hypothetical protein DACRYDRAFT_24811 [Dacryopinax primogenitus]|uniref:Uncharacterized protein n=1 Tax=Dacryopinax primogenitus (strain DJM 731) TaxID=1858805 RepID=M5G272_DACPD|nr:uncharacterized protein DACRYDRAFT_24811 [Dacryopinax primogenitus]EJT97862.1 hypothetical protein DACRYDRAFT_24811 [Dacryopinax primogenitus]
MLVPSRYPKAFGRRYCVEDIRFSLCSYPFHGPDPFPNLGPFHGHELVGLGRSDPVLGPTSLHTCAYTQHPARAHARDLFPGLHPDRPVLQHLRHPSFSSPGFHQPALALSLELLR